MSILIDSATKVLVQNITGREGTFHTAQMLAYGTKVVAGTAPGKGGQSAEIFPEAAPERLRHALFIRGGQHIIQFEGKP